MSIFKVFSLLPLVLLTSCSQLPEKVSEPEKPAVAAEPIEKAVELVKKPSVSASKDTKNINAIDPDVMFMVLTAELAGQRGQYNIALEGYMEAAKRVPDPHYAERATMIAMYMKDQRKVNEAVSLWIKQDGSNPTAQKIAALVALQAGDKTAAVNYLSALLRSDPAGFETNLLELSNELEKNDKANVVYDALDELARTTPNQAVIYFVQSLLAMQMQDKDLAALRIQRALDIQPDWDKALFFKHK